MAIRRLPVAALCFAAVTACGSDSVPSTALSLVGSATTTVRSFTVNVAARELEVGQELTLTTTTAPSDEGSRPAPDSGWDSDNPPVATVEERTGLASMAQSVESEAVLLTLVGVDSANIHVDSPRECGTAPATVTLPRLTRSPPPLVISGTLFVDPDILTPSHPTTFTAASYTGRGDRVMYDRRRSAFVTYRAFLFDASYSDGFSVEIQVNPEFQTPEASQAEAEKYGRMIGQLPRVLRGNEFQTVWIHKGNESFGGRNNNVLIHTGRAAEYESSGILEEALIHEGTHTSLDSRHASSSGWIQVQRDDMDFISTYARDNASTEDLAESFPMWMALRYRENRISSDLAATIRARMPNRLAYLDNQAFNMAPVMISSPPLPFTDDLLVRGETVIRAMHFIELRERINIQLVRFNRLVHTFTNPVVVGGVIKSEDLTEMYTAVNNALVAARQPEIDVPVVTPGVTVAMTSHINALRAAVLILEGL